MSKIEDPLIQVNWSKIKHCLGIVLGLARKLGEEALKTILKILILLVRLITKIYITLSTFAKSKQRGIWIIILIFLLLLTSFSFLNREKKCLDLLKRFNDNEQKYEELLNDYKKLYKEVEDIEKKIEEQEKKIQVYNAKKKQVIVSNRKSKGLTPEIKEIIHKHATTYNVSPVVCECVVYRESGGNPDAVGDHGSAVGVSQYHLGTFLSHRRQMGLPEIDLRRNAEASIQSMAWAISKGYGYAWTVFGGCI